MVTIEKPAGWPRAWTPCGQRRFDRVMRAIGKADKHLPLAVREALYRPLLADMRWRIKTGRALV